ncbi:hypothetical protein HYFRA_00011555 [Hymenoscyphus fraxineus]|uniref:Uncharacterized protein n=1 Tax=Hymenoscyphus fraxineus TaxID=746836 RepID=A0A9N9L5W5_9HELO|nr:hypothetical protein HYFRA_00011555 [Hymenoscyphus fraxineus]
MRSPLPFMLSVLCLVSCTIAANIPRLNREPTSGKLFYTIFPKNGTDTSKTREFVQNIVGTEDLLPWTDLEEHLVSWTVEASPDEVGKLREYADVDNVVDFHPLQVTTEQGTSENITLPVRIMEIIGSLIKREDSMEVPAQKGSIEAEDLGYLVIPRDGRNKDEYDKTEQYLIELLGKKNVQQPLIRKQTQTLLWWPPVSELTRDNNFTAQTTVEISIGEVEQRQQTNVENAVGYQPPNRRIEYGTSETNTPLVCDTDTVDGINLKRRTQNSRDGTNQDETKKTEEFLKSVVTAKYVEQPFIRHGRLRFWIIDKATPDGSQKILNNPGVKSLELNDACEPKDAYGPKDTFEFSEILSSSGPHSMSLPTYKTEVRRDIKYAT